MELQTEQSEIDWTQARSDRPRFKPLVKSANIFAGKADWEESQEGNTEIFRLSVLPQDELTIPHSFTVVGELQWNSIESFEPPLKFEWQQSKAGRFDLFFNLPIEAKCMALGERFGALNLRGAKHTLFSTDNPNHDESSDALYIALPFLTIHAGGHFVGLYIDSAAPACFDLDREMIEEGHVELLTRRGFRVYLFKAESISDLLQAFTNLVGRSQLPPNWALGHQQSRWSYHDEATVRKLASDLREHKVPCDTLVLDIDYMDDYRVFTASQARFPHFKELLSDLHQANFKVVTTVDPGVKEDDKYDIFAEGKKKDLFCKTADGKLFTEKVWAGVSAFPDFLKEETRYWWGQKQAFLTSNGVAGIWNDMNEPAFFGVNKILSPSADEMPLAREQLCMHETPEGMVPHLEVRNLYGLLMSRAAYEGLEMAHPNQRPFVLTRSGNAGIQRYAAVWLGDNKSWFEHLRRSVPMLLNMGLSGVPFTGVDIGGFWHNTDAELLLRWYEVGIFYPFFRNHCALGFRAQEAFTFAPQVERLATKLIETRYQLLPYVRNLFWEHMRTGAPLMRPLFWHHPNDPVAFDIDDQFMFGGDLLIAPVLDRGRDYRAVYFPEGKWYHFETKQFYDGGRAHMVKMPLGTVPAFVREGAILPLAEVMQHTGEYSEKSITFNVFGEKATGLYFEDDGLTLNYQAGAYNEYRLSFDGAGLKTEIVNSGFKSTRNYFVQIPGSDSPKAVNLS